MGTDDLWGQFDDLPPIAPRPVYPHTPADRVALFDQLQMAVREVEDDVLAGVARVGRFRMRESTWWAERHRYGEDAVCPHQQVSPRPSWVFMPYPHTGWCGPCFRLVLPWFVLRADKGFCCHDCGTPLHSESFRVRTLQSQEELLIGPLCPPCTEAWDQHGSTSRLRTAGVWWAYRDEH